MQVRDIAHAVLPRATDDERTRQRAVVAIRKLLNARVRPKNVVRYQDEGAPAFIDLHGRQPQSPDEIRAALHMSPRYRLWSATNRAAQEMLWVSVGQPAYRDRERMEQAASELVNRDNKLGSLLLNEALLPPAEIADHDIHLQPGGYALARDAHDVMAGALYETGGNVFSFGQGAGRGDTKAGVAIRLLEEQYPGFLPKRILDIGCSAGAASAAYAAHFPNAEVYAVDIGAAMLRYAHARAESLGVAVHCAQMDATALSFADGKFDLVVSHNLLHEIGDDNRRAMMREGVRVTRPGGVVLHQDVDIREQPSLVHTVERDWDTHFNGEIHWATYVAADLKADMLDAGLPSSVIIEKRVPAIHGSNHWYVIHAQKPL